MKSKNIFNRLMLISLILYAVILFLGIVLKAIAPLDLIDNYNFLSNMSIKERFIRGMDMEAFYETEYVRGLIYRVIVLDAMNLSQILENKYVSTLDKALSSVRSDKHLIEYNVSFKTKEQTNNYKDIVWVNEINYLTLISDNIGVVAAYDPTSIDTAEKRSATVAVVGSTLDAVSASRFLGEVESDKIADKVISALTNNLINDVNKVEGKTWTETFNKALEVIPSL